VLKLLVRLKKRLLSVKRRKLGRLLSRRNRRLVRLRKKQLVRLQKRLLFFSFSNNLFQFLLLLQPA
jgi:hypothetical protein